MKPPLGGKHTTHSDPSTMEPTRPTTPLAPSVSYARTKTTQLFSQARSIPVLWLHGLPKNSLREGVLMERSHERKHRAHRPSSLRPRDKIDLMNRARTPREGQTQTYNISILYKIITIEHKFVRSTKHNVPICKPKV